MVFSSDIFLFLFLPLVLLCYFLCYVVFKSNCLCNCVLLLASLLFYAWGEPLFVFIMVFFVLLNYIAALLIDKYEKKKYIFATLATICNIMLLVLFKYMSFITENINAILGTSYVVPHHHLPLGISFFTFQMMSYIFDVASKKAKVQKNFFDLLLYICMFPQLVAGPIVRYKTIENQMNARIITKNRFHCGVMRFSKGLFKKLLLANNVAPLVDAIFSYEIGDLSVLSAWQGSIAYTLQIYFDFCAYSDMAIGLGEMFGFHFLENFNLPYKATSITDFWRKWHISMGTWFRDYVYIPLGGNRTKTKARHIFNIAIVWLLTGLWHGANWTFVLWGALQGLLLLLEKGLSLQKTLLKNNALSHIWTMFWVILGWTLFRSCNVHFAFDYVKTMFGLSSVPFVDQNFFDLMRQFWLFVALGILLCVFDFAKLAKRLFKEKIYEWVKLFVYLVLLFFCICTVLKGSNDPFIYFNF